MAARRAVAWIGTRDARWPTQTVVGATGQQRLQQVGRASRCSVRGAITASAAGRRHRHRNVLLASVAERTREIGVRKAVGASRGAVVVQFLAESVAIAGVGSITGVLVGLAGAFAVTAIARARTGAFIYAAVTWQTVALSALAAVAVGLVFGIYPALRAARLSPIDALRHE
jgi:putative ABC transport system permease protein